MTIDTAEHGLKRLGLRRPTCLAKLDSGNITTRPLYLMLRRHHAGDR